MCAAVKKDEVSQCASHRYHGGLSARGSVGCMDGSGSDQIHVVMKECSGICNDRFHLWIVVDGVTSIEQELSLPFHQFAEFWILG